MKISGMTAFDLFTRLHAKRDRQMIENGDVRHSTFQKSSVQQYFRKHATFFQRARVLITEPDAPLVQARGICCSRLNVSYSIHVLVM